ncbi:hypothetical protein K1719_019789 [Acacia pycnantha]|nr:hypothetical protein K1719_019789 [Acacia pycnantha]
MMGFSSLSHLNGWRACTAVRVWTLIVLLLVKSAIVVYSDSDYLIGLESYDITGPAADVYMEGYANMDQVASVIERLNSRYGDLYTEKNVAISGIHTHAGPGGYLQYVVYLVTSLGFVHQSFDILVDGIEKSIIQAHENLRPGSIFVNKGELLDAGVNRSPSAYLNNPAAERSKYRYNVDKEMTILKFVDDQYGALLLYQSSGSKVTVGFEDDGHPRRISDIIPSPHDNHHELLELAASFQSPPGRPAIRASSVARRVRDTGLPCDFNHSTCGGKNKLCYGLGPGYPDE